MDEGFSDFHLDIIQPKSIRRWYHPQVNFSFDGLIPFKPLPLPQAYAIFEWGLNWCIANNAHQYLMVHAAVLEKNGTAILLPGQPGAGKSTLCAALSLRGWRLFSDEMALIDPDALSLVSNPRPISLKNESIGIIRNFSPEAVLGAEIHDTNKGTIAHLRPTRDSVARSSERSIPGIIAFPQYLEGATASLTPVTKSRAFMSLSDNAFNYSVLGLQGFNTVKALIDRCDCYRFVYSDLETAIDTFDALVSRQETVACVE
jgi:hypothetical protein